MYMYSRIPEKKGNHGASHQNRAFYALVDYRYPMRLYDAGWS